MGRREPWPVDQKRDITPRAPGGPQDIHSLSHSQGFPLWEALDLFGVAPHCPALSRRLRAPELLFRTPPWPCAIEPRLEGPREVGRRVGDPQRGSKRQSKSEPRARCSIHLIIIAIKIMMADKNGAFTVPGTLRGLAPGAGLGLSG